MLFVTFLAAASWVFSKESLVGLEPIFFMGSRFLVAGVFIAFFARESLLLFKLRDIARVASVGLVFSVALSFWILGLFHGTHLGIGSFLTSVGVLLAPCISPLFGDHPPRVVWVALPIAVIGVGMLALDSNFVFGLGEWYYLASAVAFALYINLNSRAAGRTSVVALTSLQLICVGLVLLPVSYLTEDWTITGGAPTLGWFAASVLIGTSMRFFLQTYSLKLGSASRASVILTLEPVWVVALGAVWLGETMEPIQILGSGLILFAVLLSRANAVVKFVRYLRAGR